jgi:hypothetical protein
LRQAWKTRGWSRTLRPDGTLFEMVRLDHGGEGHEGLSDEALDRFAESFPVRSGCEHDHQATAQA